MKKGELFVVLIHNFKLNMFISFLQSFSAVIISTAANISIIQSGYFDPIATNGYVMLKREFELHFIT
jgi:hypothetical protein